MIILYKNLIVDDSYRKTPYNQFVSAQVSYKYMCIGYLALENGSNPIQTDDGSSTLGLKHLRSFDDSRYVRI